MEANGLQEFKLNHKGSIRGERTREQETGEEAGGKMSSRPD